MCALLAASALAEVDLWTTSGPAGGVIQAVAPDPSDPDTLYLGTSVTSERGGVLASFDAGETWQWLVPDLGEVSVIAVDPVTPSTLYVFAEETLHKSTDGGASFAPVAPFPTTGVFFLEELLIDPSDASRLFAGVNQGCFRSTDGGASWDELPGPTEGCGAIILDVDASPDVLLAGAEEELLRSIDGGDMFSPADTGLATDIFVQDFALDPVAAGAFWMVGNHFPTDPGPAAYESTDGGLTWVQRSTGLPSSGAFDEVVIDPQAADTLFAGLTADGGVYRTTDGGAMWQESLDEPFAGGLAAVAPAPTLQGEPTTVYAGTRRGLFSSTDSGAAWSRDEGVIASEIRDVAVDPVAPGNLYAAVTWRGLLVSRTGGGSWQRVTVDAVHEPEVFSVAVDPVDPSIVYVGTGRGAYKSTDGGETFVLSNGTTLPFVPTTAVTVDPDTPSTIYAGQGNGLYKSTDSGGEWTRVFEGGALFGYNDIAVAPSDADRLYAASDLRFLRSIDGGDTWTDLGGAGSSRLSILVDPADASRVFLAANSDGLLVSVNGGNSFAAVAGAPADEILALHLPEGDPATFYAGGSEGVYVSTDQGVTWTPVTGAGLGYPAVAHLASTPSGETLFAGTDGGGVFELTFGLFGDGFESGDTSRWSQASP